MAAQVMHWHWAIRGLVLALLGAFAGLGHAPIDWPIITVIAFAAFFWVHRNTPDLRTAGWHGWAFGAGYFAFTLRWIISPFLVHIEEDGWMAPFAIVLMASGMALFWMLASLAAYRVRPRSAVLLALFLVLAEIARGTILTGFPWGLLGHVVIDTPFAHIAAYAGPHALTAFVCLAGLALLSLFSAKKTYGFVFVPVALGLWFALAVGPAPAPDLAAPIVRMIQPNAPQDQKWDSSYSGMFFNRMLGFTSEGDVPDLVVWPESAIPDLLNYAEEALAQISDAARGAPVIVGVNRREGQRYYNSFVLLGRGGLVGRLYDKQHLVPFGEYVPAGEMLGFAGFGNVASSTGGGFTSGTTDRLMDVPGIGNVRPLICYEGIFAEEISTQNRPRTMILITNDAWFGKDAGPFQHLAQARLRAIEQGLPMVRVANTGVSAMIDAKGRVGGRIALNTAGFLDVSLPPADKATIFSSYGDWPFLVLLLVSIAALLFFRPRETG